MTQAITVHDTVPPTASNPLGIFVSCTADIPSPNSAVVNNIADNCAQSPTVQWVNDLSDSNTCPELITRTYAITDDCGNQTFVTQAITVHDTVPPTASNLPILTVSHAGNLPLQDISSLITISDNCTQNPIITWVSDSTNGNTCNNEQITRIYRITDDCGNSTTVTQIIEITATYPVLLTPLNQVVCQNQPVIFDALFSPPGSQINWSNSIVNGVSFTPTTPGTFNYTVTASDYDCVTSEIATLQVNELPVATIQTTDTIGCAPFPLTMNYTSESSTLFTDCLWNMGDGGNATNCGSVNYTYSNAGMYTISLEITDENGCQNTMYYPSQITVEEIPNAQFTISNTTLNNILLETDVNFINQSTNAIAYSWNFGDGTVSNHVNPSNSYNTENAGSYQAQLIAYSANQCSDTAYQTISVKEELLFYVPNAFTPDAGNHNTTFFPVFTSGFEPASYAIQIYNRWGEIIYESNDYTKGWDGTYNENPVQSGTYIWIIQFNSNVNTKKYTKTGHVSLLR